MIYNVANSPSTLNNFEVHSTPSMVVFSKYFVVIEKSFLILQLYYIMNFFFSIFYQVPSPQDTLDILATKYGENHLEVDGTNVTVSSS